MNEGWTGEKEKWIFCSMNEKEKANKKAQFQQE